MLSPDVFPISGAASANHEFFFLLERVIPWSERWIGSKGDVHADVGLVLAAGAAGALLEPIARFAAWWRETR